METKVKPAEHPDAQDCRLTVYFDGACQLCRREIAHYRRREGADSIRWIDASTDDAALAAAGLSRGQAMSEFHVLDERGQWHKGTRGFIAVWRRLRGYRWLGRLLGRSRWLPLADRLYARFAQWRIRHGNPHDGRRSDS